MLKGEECPYPKTARRLAQKQQTFKKCVTAYSSRMWAWKVDGAKLATDTIDVRKNCGRQAFCPGRSMSARIYGPVGNEDPGSSRILAD